jgi:hypothetical protein
MKAERDRVLDVKEASDITMADLLGDIGGTRRHGSGRQHLNGSMAF